MAADDPFADLLPSSQPTPRVPGIIRGRPDPTKARDQQLQEDAAARARRDQELQEATARRTELEWNATHNPDGTPKEKLAAEKPLPAWAEKPYSEQIGIYGGIKRGLDTFKDDFAGNALTGGLENSIQGAFSGFGTEGQRDWWSQFGSTDNVIRNDLFGAALTEHEKAAYAATTVSPNMDPKEVKRNLQSRRDILSAALKRRTNFLKAQGYSKEAIEALAGEYAQDLGANVVAPDAPPPADDSQPGIVNTGHVALPTDVANKIEAGRPLSPEQASAYDAFMKANPKASQEQVGSWFDSMGLPRPTNLDAVIRDRDKGLGFVPGSSITQQAPDISDVRGSGGFVEGADATARGFADTATLGFSDELAAAGDTLFGSGTMDSNLARQRAIDKYDAENSPWLRGVGQLAGGLAIPYGSGARGMAELAGIGGATGALYGAGSGEDWAGRGVGAVTGGLTGAALGATFGKLSQVMGRRGGGGPGPTRGGQSADIDAASRDLNVPMMPGDVGGAPAAYGTSLLRMTPGGAQPITAAARRSQEAAGDALSAIAAREGQPMQREALGETVRQGALAYREGSRNSIGRLYSRAADEAGDTRVDPKAALTALDQHISELGEIPGGGEGLSVLQGLRDDLAQRGTITVNGIRGMRTQLRQKFAKDNLRGSDIERRVNEVVDAASNDLVSSLQAQGKSAAARTYAEADRQWADRIKILDDTIMPIIGKRGEKSGEQIADALNAAAKGNNARLSSLFDTLPEEEAGAARASMIEAMGRASSGNQNAAGDAFSFGTFLSNWDKVGPSAKNAIFRGENRKAIDQLALLAEKSKNAAKWTNYSNTGIGVLGGITGLSGAAGVATLGKTVAGEYALGRLLASPRVAKAILNIAQAKTPSAISARIGSLSAVAAKESALAPEITGLQQRLFSAMNDNMPMRSAASERQEEQK